MKASKMLMLTTCILFVMSLLFGGVKECNIPNPGPYEDKEVGDFVVRFYAADYCEIKGTTAQGNDKKFLVIPETIDGVRVEAFGVYQPFLMYNDKLLWPEIVSDKLEKVYFESAVKLSYFSFSLSNCPNLEKVMYPNLEVYPYIMSGGGYSVYYPRSIYEIHKNEIVREPANVSYYYNYENIENSGYYWIDDCEYDGTIEFIPKDPVREGYTFDGWHKEPECLNKWNFDIDTLPAEVFETIQLSPEIITEDGRIIPAKYAERTVYQETMLFAKWILNSTDLSI